MTGKQVRKLRLKHKLSQQELANLARVSFVTISRIERGYKSQIITQKAIEKALYMLDKKNICPVCGQKVE